MKTTLVLPEALSGEITAAAQNPLETAGVLIARVSEQGAHRRLLGVAMNWVPDLEYRERTPVSLSIASSGYVPPLAHAERLGAVPIWLHTHPSTVGAPIPSQRDMKVDSQIADLFRLRACSPYYGALIVSPRDQGFTFTGFLENDVSEHYAIEAVWSVGDRVVLTPPFGAREEVLSPMFDRNVRAFGTAVQRTLGKLRVGVVGCGGTGSAVAEQLVRLGVRDFVLADPDRLSESNITRVYGSRLRDVGRPKVEVIADHLRGIAGSLSVEAIPSMLTLEPTARRFSTCDVIFGCSDDNAGRLVLSRLSTYYLIPVFDCGVLLTSAEDGKLIGIDGRVTTLVPGQGCLVCRNRIDLKRAATELLTPEERKRRVDEGYAPALGQNEPAVVTFTNLVASTAVSELLERLIDYGPAPRPSEVILRCREREISTNLAKPRDGHYCNPLSKKLGLGDTTPFLEQTWPTLVS